MDISKNLTKNLSVQIIENHPISKYTWFRTGGKSKFFFEPSKEIELIQFLKKKPNNLDTFPLGAGSNLLFRDNGFKGIVIHMKKMNKIIMNEKGIITVQCGAIDADVARFAKDKSRSGLEFLIGIPGTIGGGIKMNSGAFGSEFKKILIDVKAVNKRGDVKNFDTKQMKLGYRKNSLDDQWIFLSARFKTTEGNKDEIHKKMREIIKQRKDSQPTGVKTGGSTFMNSDKYKAWQLIDDAGCRGLRCGGAKISEKHCNFIINESNANSEDIEKLGEKVRKKVFLNSGKKLKWEIKIVGEK